MESISSRVQSIPTLKRANTILSWVVGVILFITAVVYAGVRGVGAYHHLPATQSTFVPDSSVNFPAITVCGIETTTPITAIECIKEHDRVENLDCLPAVKKTTAFFEGAQLSCVTYNEPADSSQVMKSNSVDDELGIMAVLDISRAQAEIGCLVYLHDQGAPLELEEAFAVDVGKQFEVWVTKEIITLLNGTSEVDWHARTTFIGLKPSNDTRAIIDMDIAFVTQGYTQSQVYYVYAVDNWIGEVGGLSALLFFLHQAFVFIVMTIAIFIYQRKYPDSARGQMLQDVA